MVKAVNMGQYDFWTVYQEPVSQAFPSEKLNFLHCPALYIFTLPSQSSTIPLTSFIFS